MFFRKKDIPMPDEKLNIDGLETNGQGTVNSRGTKASRGVKEDQPMPTVAQLRRRMHQQIFLIILSLTVAGVSTGAFISKAWFANNKEVESSNSSITSDTPTPSLYIRPSDKKAEKTYADTTKRDSGATLYPISTINLTDWFYASSFVLNSYTNGESDTSSSTVPVADNFTNAKDNITADSAGSTSYSYTNSFEGKTKTAYYLASDNLYTTGGNMDVYLNPTEPIRVELRTSSASSADTAAVTKNENFKKAIRVGLKSTAADGTVTTLIYAPVEPAASESSSGNTSGDSAKGYYKAIAVPTDSSSGSSWQLVNASSVVTHDLSAYQAGGTSPAYTAGTTKLCTATESGVDVEIYVWLEGTASTALLGLSDNDAYGVNVNISYVGVPVSGSD